MPDYRVQVPMPAARNTRAGRLAYGPMTAIRPLPPAYPTTATLMLLASGGDPFQCSAGQASTALRAIEDLLALLPAGQAELAAQFRPAAGLLGQAVSQLSSWQLTLAETTALKQPHLPSWGEAQMLEDVWVGRQPPEPAGETVYGFQASISPLLGHLVHAIRNLAQGDATYGAGLRRLMLAAAVAEFAGRVTAAVTTFTAAVWEYEQPSIPTIAGASARVTIRSSARVHPQARWARAARVLFLPGRVEITTAAGLEIIGDQMPVAFLMHVVPPSPRAALTGYDPAERYVAAPLQDELGVIHLCSADGYSLGAIAIVDWLSQPEFQIGQRVATRTGEEMLPARDLLVWGLQVSGILDGAAVLNVPIRRGVMHPPMPPGHADSRPTSVRNSPPGTAGYQPAELIRLLRPASHRQPHRGTGAGPGAAYKRRLQRMKFWRKNTGPGSVVNHVVRAGAPVAIWVGGLGSAYLFAGTFWARLCMLWALVAVAEPWLWWGVEHLRDRRVRRMRAVYRPGKHPGGTRAFFGRAAVLYDGTDIGVRGATGHIAWAGGPSDPHLGVVAVQRLMDAEGPWAIAFVDRSSRWRFVLPIEHWAPSGDLGGLAGFAKAAGLSVADASASRVAASNDVFDERSAIARSTSSGPPTRGMVILMFWCLTVVPFTLAGSQVATVGLLALAAIAVVPAAARALWRRLLARTT